MAEGDYSLTFPMSRESEFASRLKTVISDMLPLFTDDYSDDVLSEYITLLVCNGKSQRQAREDLEAFLREQSSAFVACLWELLLKDFPQGKQDNSASEPKTAVDFGSHDILNQQGLSSTRHTDYDQKPTNAMMNEKLISGTPPVKDIEAQVTSKVKSMKILRQELKGAQLKDKDDWNLPGVNYSRKILRSIVVSANKQQCGINLDKYEKPMDEGTGVLQNLPCLPEREMSRSVPSGGAMPARSHDTASCQEMKPHVSVWDRLGRPRSSLVRATLPKSGIQADENKVLQHHGPPFPAAFSEQQRERVEREVPAVGYRHAVSESHKARQPKSGTITSTEPQTAYNLSRKRRYGIINPNSRDAPVCDFSSVLQYEKPTQDIEKLSLLSHQCAKPDLFTEILDVKQKLEQLEIRIKQSKLKKQKVGELKWSPQSGELQDQQDVSESRIIHVTNVHYAAREEAISMLFSKCGAVENVKIVTDPVNGHLKGAAFVTFATKESINKAIALNNTMFYSKPIKVWRHMVASRVMSEKPAPQVVQT